MEGVGRAVGGYFSEPLCPVVGLQDFGDVDTAVFSLVGF